MPACALTGHARPPRISLRMLRISQQLGFAMDEHLIFLIGGGDDESGKLVTSIKKDVCHIAFDYRGRSLDAKASDYFEAFCQIRLRLEEDGLIPFCYGASLNVYPSGTARDMGLGLKAYKLTIGKHARMQDLVEIFTAGEDVIPAFVSTQQEFYRTWINQSKA